MVELIVTQMERIFGTTPQSQSALSRCSMSLWCTPCDLTHDFTLEQVEMVVYALAARVSFAEPYAHGSMRAAEPLTGKGSQSCLLGHLEETGPGTQAAVLRSVQHRENSGA